MNRPEALNALSMGMFRELEANLRDASKDRTVSSIIIKGEGRAFSAGLDVKEVSGFLSRHEARNFVYGLVKPFWIRFLESEKPILSMVHGPAYGAGAEIALASDMVVRLRSPPLPSPEGGWVRYVAFQPPSVNLRWSAER